jgi:hypothetical protein
MALGAFFHLLGPLSRLQLQWGAAVQRSSATLSLAFSLYSAICVVNSSLCLALEEGDTYS